MDTVIREYLNQAKIGRKQSYKNLAKAALSVLLELFYLFGEYRGHIVLVGGWVPEFLFAQHERVNAQFRDATGMDE